MRGWFGMVLCLVGIGSFVSPAAAQVIGSPNASLVWDQPAPTLLLAQEYTYRFYPDGATTGQVLSTVSCAVAPDPAFFTCRAAFPPFTPAEHTLAITAGNDAGESLPSATITFTFVVLPQSPLRVRIERP